RNSLSSSFSPSLFSLTRPPPPRSTLFPYTTLFRSRHVDDHRRDPLARRRIGGVAHPGQHVEPARGHPLRGGPPDAGGRSGDDDQDRKSTRLNSSHSQISYAVFCLKKKKEKIEQ